MFKCLQVRACVGLLLHRNRANAQAFDAAWEALLSLGAGAGSVGGEGGGGGGGGRERAVRLPVRQGRHFTVRRAAVTEEAHSDDGIRHIAARFEFAELCAADLGSADFSAVAANFPSVMLEGTCRLPAAARPSRQCAYGG